MSLEQILANGEWSSPKVKPFRSLTGENVTDCPRGYALEAHHYISAEGLFLASAPTYGCGRERKAILPDLLMVHWLKDSLLALPKCPLELHSNKASIHAKLLPSLSLSCKVRSSHVTNSSPRCSGPLSTLSKRQAPNKCIVDLIAFGHLPLRGLELKSAGRACRTFF